MVLICILTQLWAGSNKSRESDTTCNNKIPTFHNKMSDFFYFFFYMTNNQNGTANMCLFCGYRWPHANLQTNLSFL